METRTARLTILIDPNKKAVFEEVCLREDLTPSQVVRRLIRTYIEQRLGHPWKPGQRPELPGTPSNRKAHSKTSRAKKAG